MKPKSISKKLSCYSTLAMALGACTEAQAQHMVYTDVNPDTVVNKILPGIQDYLLDLNNDNQFDFDLKLSGYYSSYMSDRMTLLKISPASGNAVMDVVQTAPFYHFVLANNAGHQLNATQNWGSAYNEILARRQQSVVYSNFIGNWAGATDKFIGLKFQIAGATHFGWARLSVDSDINSFTLKDYAYDSVANENFFTGLITSSNQPLPEHALISFYKNELNIVLPDNSELYKLNIYSVEGKKCLDEIQFEKQTSVSLNELPAGLYFGILTDEHQNSFNYKLLVVH